MMETQGRKPPKKGRPFTEAELVNLTFKLSFNKILTEFSLQDWADRVNYAWMRKRADVRVGIILAFAKRIVKHGEFGRLFAKHPQAVARPVLMSPRTAERLIRICRHPTLPDLAQDPTHGSNLPSSWRTLSELARYAPPVVALLLSKGLLSPTTTRAQVLWRLRPVDAWERAKSQAKPEPTLLS